jgi:LacI family transcriptional regulator
MTSRFIRIGLIFNCSHGYCRAVLRGIKSYAETRPDWILTLVPPEVEAIERLALLRPAGLIAQIFSRDLAARLRGLGRPLVNASAILHDLPLPRVCVDDAEVGRLAAVHLLDRGLRHFGFVGHAEHGYSHLRETGYCETIAAAGYATQRYYGLGSLSQDHKGGTWAIDGRIRKWMASLPKPVGIFAANDLWGHQLLEICRQVGRRVPDEVAMLSAGNDELLCELARPSLTSVALPGERIGVEAASALDLILAGGAVPAVPRVLPPQGIVTRHSTDIMYVEDPDVAAAVRFIRNHAFSSIQVNDVLREIPVSRRTLERRFRAVLNRGLSEEIRRTRVERACFLLGTSSAPMAEIAQRSGFGDAKRFSAIFHRATGLTPTAYRRAVRPSRGEAPEGDPGASRS